MKLIAAPVHNIVSEAEDLAKMTKVYGVELHLSYGEELFQLLNHTAAWTQILKYLKKRKTEIPDFPETNFDPDAESSFEEIKDLSPSIYRQIFEDDAIFEEIILTLFPKKRPYNSCCIIFNPKHRRKSSIEQLPTYCKVSYQ